MADREHGDPPAPRDPPERHDPAPEAEAPTHRVVRLADLAGHGPSAPVASLRDLDHDGERAPVVDLAAWRRSADDPSGPVAPVVRPEGSRSGERPARIARLTPDAPSTAGSATHRATQGDGSAADIDAWNVEGAGGRASNGRGRSAASRTAGGADWAPRRRGARLRTDRSATDGSQPAGVEPGVEPDLEPEADPVAVAREICLRLLTERARTRQELAQALRKRGVPDDAAGTALERFDEVGLIDDAAFAGQWVRSRHTRRGLARRAIAVELRRKGVADEVAQQALAEVDTAAEEHRARELVDRKLRTIPADTPERRVTAGRKLVGMLARRGYPGGIAYRVVREALAAHGAEQDELGEPDL